MMKYMKKLLASVLIVALLVGCFAVCGSAETVDVFGNEPEDYCEYLYGDVNLDWKVDAVDYMLLKRVVLGSYTLTIAQAAQVADVNRDGMVNGVDYLLVKRSILGTYESLGIVIEELEPKPYDSLTDEELYALIDKELAADPDPEGRNLLLVGFRRIKRETQGAAVLRSLGFSDDFGDPIYLDVGHTTNLYLMVLMEIPPEQLREVIFKLRRCDEIGGIHTHGDQWSYAE